MNSVEHTESHPRPFLGFRVLSTGSRELSNLCSDHLKADHPKKTECVTEPYAKTNTPSALSILQVRKNGDEKEAKKIIQVIPAAHNKERDAFWNEYKIICSSNSRSAAQEQQFRSISDQFWVDFGYILKNLLRGVKVAEEGVGEAVNLAEEGGGQASNLDEERGGGKVANLDEEGGGQAANVDEEGIGNTNLDEEASNLNGMGAGPSQPRASTSRQPRASTSRQRNPTSSSVCGDTESVPRDAQSGTQSTEEYFYMLPKILVKPPLQCGSSVPYDRYRRRTLTSVTDPGLPKLTLLVLWNIMVKFGT
ncbi:hypothetical protein RND71_021365 [Anisodus tanguticus]|uniref:Uncharacterized protein n=1 Tax=Anisodus tanguticus TaxID=243964 RepID=A0AAE1RY86_9SOLA|nr:hypothetical protein RND71_021365 [Anisodus tanguticus]